MQVETNVGSHEVSPWRAKKRHALSAPSSESAAKSKCRPRSTSASHCLTDEPDPDPDPCDPDPDRSGNPSSPRQRPPVCFVGNKYILLDKVEGNSLFMCVDVQTRQELVCKVVGREAGALLAAHYRVDGQPHLNPLRDVLIGSRHMYLIFPASHGDLHSYVRHKGSLAEDEARRLFRQMASAVRTCHDAGIVLKDLKLRKFVFADNRRTSLNLESLEDAVVLPSADDDLLHDKRGCPAYVSPEILRAKAKYSGRAADMWSLGVILYTILVGRYPFNDTEHASLFGKISRGQFYTPDWLTPRARCLIRSLLRLEPTERLSAPDVLRHPWLQDDDLDLDLSGHLSGPQLAAASMAIMEDTSDQLVPDVM